MIAMLGRIRPRTVTGTSAELVELRHRVVRLRREVRAMQTRADALYGQPEDEPYPWRDPQAATHG